MKLTAWFKARADRILLVAAIGLAGGLGGAWALSEGLDRVPLWWRAPQPEMVVLAPLTEDPAEDTTFDQTASALEWARRQVPLVRGDHLPDFEARGWINGSAPLFDPPSKRLIVLDVWADWCPFCRQSAPMLVELQRKFRDRDVQFVSVTPNPQETVQEFVDTFGIRWSCGYGLSFKSLADLHCVGSGPGGVATRPTLYLLRGDGRVLWSDECARYNHASVQQLQSRLEAAIASALDAATAYRPSAAPFYPLPSTETLLESAGSL